MCICLSYSLPGYSDNLFLSVNWPWRVLSIHLCSSYFFLKIGMGLVMVGSHLLLLFLKGSLFVFLNIFHFNFKHYYMFGVNFLGMLSVEVLISIWFGSCLIPLHLVFNQNYSQTIYLWSVFGFYCIWQFIYLIYCLYLVHFFKIVLVVDSSSPEIVLIFSSCDWMGSEQFPMTKNVEIIITDHALSFRI